MWKKIRILLFILLIFLCSLLIVAAKYYSKEYSEQTFDQIIYYAITGLSGTGNDVIKDIVKTNIALFLVTFICLLVITSKGRKK